MCGVDKGFILGDINHICFSSLLSTESSLLLMRPCHIAAITHPKGTGGTSRTMRREVGFGSSFNIVIDVIVPVMISQTTRARAKCN